ncbi:Glutaredoxin-like domain [Salipaludibacillus aurantiacus]|uniref:Glutaredoxin-like domain n=2 Tax=Salipaludibacillus aurantiacus TaxID=1601833 RepID=A0A1H9X785_9BACI|nr:Glutaredoxin-like domain [Salipaludibacillus aurantiacus]
MSDMKVFFYTKEKCPLCDKGLEKLKSLEDSADLEIEMRDIYSKDEWLEKYQIRIPVIEDGGGRVIDEGIISKEELVKNLNLK